MSPKSKQRLPTGKLVRKIIAGAFLSLDGVMQAPGGAEEDPTASFHYGGWTWPHYDETTDAFIDEQLFNSQYDLLLGHKTYEIFAAYWPYQQGEIAQRFNSIRKYVVTSHPEFLTWEGSEALVGDPVQAVTALKKTDGPDLLIQGSSKLYPALLGAGLIDRMFLTIIPVMLGKGKRLFTDAAQANAWPLVEHHVSSTGVIMAIYEKGGEIQVGTFGPQEPSEAELARREKRKTED